MKIHCFQHVIFETPGTILEWAQLHNHTITYTRFYQKNYTIPFIQEIDVLLIMGGNMNVDEEDKFPWLKQEKIIIKDAIEANKKVLGICLGAQLIAATLGSKVYPGIAKEIGFFPVQFTETALLHPFFNHLTNPYTVFHWHGDTFDLPANAQLIASSAVCKQQAFLFNHKVLGLQFHFEMDEIVNKQMIKYDGDELNEKGNTIQLKKTIQNNYLHLTQNKNDFFNLLDKFFA